MTKALRKSSTDRVRSGITVLKHDLFGVRPGSSERQSDAFLLRDEMDKVDSDPHVPPFGVNGAEDM